MNLRNVSNQDVTTLATCASEPIHIPGAIQPHGVLIAIDNESVVRFCSQNCEAFFGIVPAQVLEQPLQSISSELNHRIVEALKENTLPVRTFTFLQNGQVWTVFVHEQDELITIELESPAPVTETVDLFEQTREFVQIIERTQSLPDLCQRMADQVRRITGFDRVMIYRFDADYNGEVFAESKNRSLEPFLHLHYPHTDIPAQARELYLRNHIRLIADVSYQPVPLLTTENSGHSNLDLSDSVLRSVSPIHIQYLKNMGVGATLTISLLSDERLWGLIACHHYSPKHLSVLQRQAALMQGHFLTSQLKVRLVAEEYAIHTMVEAHLQQLLNTVPQAGDFALKMNAFSSLLPVANASGVAILHNGKLYEKGVVPPADKTKVLFTWLAENVPGMQFSTSQLRSHYPGGEKISRYAAGILYHKLGNAKKDAIIWFREEIEKTINWAGDPHEAVRKVVENNLNPRSSFSIFKEIVRFQSREWRFSEISAASRFSGALQNHFHLEYLKAEETKQRLLNEQLMKANKELANINWITSHDLKEPLRKILVFSSKMMHEGEKELSEKVTASITRIQQSAVRMQTLVNDIIAYTLVDDKNTTFVPTDLNKILKEVADEYADELREKRGFIHITSMPVVTAIPYQMRQLFVNLVGNSLKFAKADTAPEINIQCEKLTGNNTLILPDGSSANYRLSVADNGIGFDSTYAEKLFDIFYRLSDQKTYTGTGIGLAICKRIVENHGGTITAMGEEGKGATIEIYLPQPE
ncbi:MAG: GAF domain-containing protein [Chitinophagaceae bacterium]|nr:MAG: GAF domain-containing protein [Chitinophagaceae bacterium]